MHGSTIPCLRQKRPRSAKPAHGLVSACTCTMKTRRRRRPNISPHRLCSDLRLRGCGVLVLISQSIRYPSILHSTSSYPLLLGSLSCCKLVMLVRCCLLIFVQSCIAKMLPAAVGVDYGIMNICVVPFFFLISSIHIHSVQVYRKIHVASN